MNEKTPRHSVSRRDFLTRTTALGGLMSVALLVEACRKAGLSTPTGAPAASGPTLTSRPSAIPLPSATPSVKPSPPMQPGAIPTDASSPTLSPTSTVLPQADVAQVAFVKTRDRVEGVRRALELLGYSPVQGKDVFLKPNFNSPDPTPGSTHIDVLSALVEELWNIGAQAITVADRSGMADTRRAMEQVGVFSLARELGFETLVLNELEENEWVMLQPPGSHWKQGFPFARPSLEAEALVQTCCLKTHRFGGHFTMSLKNSVGMVAKYGSDGYDYMRELHSSPYQRLMIAEINAAYEPALIVMDGVEAFVNGGPESGERVWPEVMLAGSDRVALDAVGVALLRHFGTTPEVSRGAIFDQEQIARAVELGLGIDGPEKIRFLAADPESEAYASQIQETLSAG
jgi:uncharacterized protein (DUF362 family)